MSFKSELKEFLMRGSVVDMAVGIVIGGAFGKIVTSFVNDILMPPLGLLGRQGQFADFKLVLKQAVMEGSEVITPAVTWNYARLFSQLWTLQLSEQLSSWLLKL